MPPGKKHSITEFNDDVIISNSCRAISVFASTCFVFFLGGVVFVLVVVAIVVGLVLLKRANYDSCGASMRKKTVWLQEVLICFTTLACSDFVRLCNIIIV